MIPSYAAKNDLDFITDVKRICDDGVASVAERAMRRHLWYLSENLIGLAIFDDRISPEQKAEMVKGMKRPSTTKNPRCPESKTPINLNRPLSAFCSVRSMQVLKSLLGGQQPTFLELSPETWNTDSCFKCAKEAGWCPEGHERPRRTRNSPHSTLPRQPDEGRTANPVPLEACPPPHEICP
ncbi:hypothetical protein GWK47_041125 [Chionoecetes opilio]|uniref:Uncharacterized protein n=1 Tax=Chionoecetes opilio TaxID=41210 RepID=A0A8J5CZL8_CHIOP|nr:hypothetical protein GWK47_041125 [Chionoecetes opilio]